MHYIKDLLTIGFTYHEKTPLISQSKMNPVNGLSLADNMLTLLTSQLANTATETTWNTHTNNNHCPPSPVSLRNVLHNNYYKNVDLEVYF